MALTDYRFNPNSFDAIRVAIITVATFSSSNGCRKAILEFCTRFLAPYQVAAETPHKLTKDYLKYVKKQALSEVRAMIKYGTGKFAVLLQLEPDRVRAVNIAMTLARWPEWYLHPESYLNEIADNLWEHRNEINAITFYEEQKDGTAKRICPYDPKISVDPMLPYESMQKQAKSIDEFCDRENIHSTITVDAVIKEMQNIAREALYCNKHDAFEQGFFDSISYIRSHSASIVNQMRTYKAGKAPDLMFGRSESRAVISNDPAVMHMLKLCGWPKNSCPNVLSNIFCTKVHAVALKPQPGQIPIDRSFDYFDTAPGLGPAMKIRYVFNLIMEYQNYLSPLADLIKEADQKFDAIQEAYTNQMLGLSSELADIVDAYCIDATGYSDYLFRGMYYYLLQLYGMPKDIIQDIMNIFGLPIKVGDHICPVPFGAMQGCKLLVFVMNHANRLIGIIARRLSEQKVDIRHNAGDDTITGSSKEIIKQQTIDNELRVFAIFNIAVNPLKTAHLHTDGYFDFCSKYFMRASNDAPGVVSISGLPPKLIGKDMPSIKSFTEIFRVLDLSKTVRNPIIDVWKVCKPLLMNELESGCRLPNALGRKYTVEEKERLALNVSYKLGGLAEEGEIPVEQTARHALVILERMIVKYRFQPTGIFQVIQGIVPDDTELYRALGTVEHLSLTKILCVVQDLRMGIETGMMEESKLNECCDLISRLDRCIVKGTSISSTQSTYHRITASRDIDSLLEPNVQPNFKMLDELATPSDLLELAVMAAISAENYCDIDRIRRYMGAKKVIHKYRDRFFEETFGLYTNYYARDDNGKIVKLTTQERDVGCNRLNRYESIDDMDNKELQSVCQLIEGDRGTLRALLQLQSDVGMSALLDYLHLTIGELSKTMKRRMLIQCREYEKKTLLKKLQDKALKELNGES